MEIKSDKLEEESPSPLSRRKQKKRRKKQQKETFHFRRETESVQSGSYTLRV
jgi:hypothetical protein